ncbi:MAG: putative polysaccharide biosynthesis protein [Eubacteriales bacterium]
MSKSAYVKGAGIIALGGIIAKLLGLFYKIPIYNILDSFGYGLYYNSYAIYNLILTISIVGIPVAISKMIAEKMSLRNYYGAYRVFKVSMTTLVFIGTLSSAFLYFGAHFIIASAEWNTDTYYAIIGLSLAPFFVSIVCAVRGFFQGMQIMAPSAISQIIESFVRVIFGIGLCYYFANRYGQPIGAGGASSGATFGALFTAFFLIYMLIKFMANFKKLVRKSKKVYKKESTRRILKRLVQIAIPVTFASAVVSLFGIINAYTYVPRLALAGFDNKTATIMFGDYGLAQTLINVPLTLSAAMAITLVPAISESFALKDKSAINHKTELGLRIMILLSLPCAIGLSVYAEPIFKMLFPQSLYGGTILKCLSYSTIFIMIANTLQSVLQGIDRFIIPVKNLLIALLFKFILNYIFIAMPHVNIYGIVISNTGAYIICSVLNYLSLKKYLKMQFNYKQTIVKPLTSALIMAIVGINIYSFLVGILGNSIAVMLGILICIIVYFTSLLLLKGITEEEMLIIPGGEKLRVLFKKFL